MPETCASVTLSRGGAVTMVIDAPDEAEPGRTPVVVLAHGAGNDLRSPFLEFFATALSARGFVIVRFNFAYKERGGTRPPDRMDALADCYRDVILAAARRTGSPPGPLFLGGKSMGGRVAALLTAQGVARPSGLVFLGFPLHPAGDTERLRTDDLPNVKQPMLFVQGSRDALCDLALLRQVRTSMKLPGALHVIEGGDHSFQLPAAQRARQRAEMDGAADAVASFVSKVLARKR